MPPDAAKIHLSRNSPKTFSGFQSIDQTRQQAFPSRLDPKSVTHNLQQTPPKLHPTTRREDGSRRSDSGGGHRSRPKLGPLLLGLGVLEGNLPLLFIVRVLVSIVGGGLLEVPHVQLATRERQWHHP